MALGCFLSGRLSCSMCRGIIGLVVHLLAYCWEDDIEQARHTWVAC